MIKAMIKALSTTALFLASASLAAAAPLPAPPTAVYTPSAQTACSGETLHVYFPEGTSALTPASRAMLQAAQARLDGCILGQVSLTASADDARNEAQAETLSAARIEAVSTALETYELSGMRVSSEPRAEDAHTLWTPMDRKVEIRVTAWAPEVS